MKTVLGLGGSIHDYATCLICGKEMIAIEDERLTRVRYALSSKNPCVPSLNYCLNAANLSIFDIDVAAMNDDLADISRNCFSGDVPLFNHHLTHAYSTFFTSPFEQSAILIVDGAGSKRYLNDPSSTVRETTTYAHGIGNKIQILSRVYGTLRGNNPLTNSQTIMSNSLGEFYRVIAETLELGWLSGPGKVMGLAPYGATYQCDHFVDKILKYVKFLPKGQFKIKINGKDGLINALYQMRQTERNQESSFRIDASLAQGGQIVLEKILEHLYKETKSENLCIAGGVGLNSIANSKIHLISKFKNVHIFYSSGDSGTAVGAAIGGYLDLYSQGSELIRFSGTPYLGRSYQSSEIEKALIDSSVKYNKTLNLHQEIACWLSQGKIVAWYHGKSEFGPRALGNRSLLADPRDPNIRDRINLTVKNREWFRPLAPAVIEEKAENYFRIPTISPWMQFVWPVREEFYEKLPGITHVDGSARVQTVSEQDNPSFYQLLCKFGELSEFPILLNTSFNIKGEPIVETPTHAIRVFLEAPIDILVLEDYIVIKV